MDRVNLIHKLKRRLSFLNQSLIKTYNARDLASFLRIEKEIQIQASYLQAEGK